MNLIAGWPTLVVTALAVISLQVVADTRSRSIVNWLVLPLLLEAAVMKLLYLP